MANGTIFWDFDGTLAYRPGMWSGCLVETLDEHIPGHGIEIQQVRPFLRSDFPWDSPDVPHPELSEPGAWWDRVSQLLTAAYEGVGIEPGRAAELARLAQARYVDPTCGWTLFPDTRLVLESLYAQGWRHLVLSNHVPELPAITDHLGLTPLVEEVITSAAVGFEKPHQEIFRLALETVGPPDAVWMVGDNPKADVEGAEAAGIRAVLVRGEKGTDLSGAAAIITGR